MTGKTILITGGARSGKSRYAQELAIKSDFSQKVQPEGKQVLFVATAEAGDEEMRQRIKAHQLSRPSSWKTLEAPIKVGAEIAKKGGGAGVIILDDITLLVNNVFNGLADRATEQIDAALADREVTREIEELIECFDRLDAVFIMVTNEVGMGLVPANPIDRLYRDLLGKANRMLAGRADEVYLMVAGLPVRIKPAGV